MWTWQHINNHYAGDQNNMKTPMRLLNLTPSKKKINPNKLDLIRMTEITFHHALYIRFNPTS
jgi:hypothetical protein